MYSIVEANLFIVCCCLPTLRRFFRHVAPRFIGENSRQSSDKRSSGHGLRTWGSSRPGPKRQYDTLMNTVDGGKGEDEIPLAGVEAEEALKARESIIQTGVRKCKKTDSKETILYERTVEVMYDGKPKCPPPIYEHDQV